MKQYYFYILFFFFLSVAFGQQDSQYTQYMYNTMSVNPGYAGTREVLSVIGAYRTQWIGLEGAPKTLNFAAHTPLGGRSLANLGLDVTSDNIGASTQKSIAANFLRSSLRARRTASAFSRARRSDGFSYERRNFISRKTPSRCIFFLRTFNA